MSWARSVGTVRGAGIRANCENSSTSPFSDSTSPTIVVVHSSTSARACGGAAAKCRRSRSADSWIGVSGFLISCARRRATSRHAATFCARMSGVTSSSTSTTPSGRAAVADEGGRDGGQVHLLAVARDSDLLRSAGALRPRLPAPASSAPSGCRSADRTRPAPAARRSDDRG